MVENLPAVQEMQETQVQSRVEKIPWRRAWQPTPEFLPRKSHGQRAWLAQSIGSQRDMTEATKHACNKMT